jgi:hypothetical protein
MSTLLSAPSAVSAAIRINLAAERWRVVSTRATGRLEDPATAVRADRADDDLAAAGGNKLFAFVAFLVALRLVPVGDGRLGDCRCRSRA